jgi:formylglycine-generating enzyme required for sulfatase activity
MAGNAWEWTADWFDPKAYRWALREDPQGPAAGTERVLRGGSWKSPATSVRSARHSHPLPSHRSISMGFRIVTPSSASE